VLASYSEAFNNLGYRIFYSAAPESGVLSPRRLAKLYTTLTGSRRAPRRYWRPVRGVAAEEGLQH